MKILQIHNYYKIRGGECSVVNMEEALLSKNGHNVQQFVRDSQNIDNMSVSGKINSFVNIPYNRRIYQDIAQTIKSDRPDIAHVHNVFPLISPSVYAALHDCNIPVVQTIHNYRFMCPNGQFFVNGHICEDCQSSGFYSALKKKCFRNNRVLSTLYAISISRMWRTGVIQKYITKYIALNYFVAKKLAVSGIPDANIEICGNFIEPLASSFSNKKNYILFLGRLSAEKGINTLLHALSKLDNVRLKIAGSGPEESNLKEQAKRYCRNNVDFLGHVSGDEKYKLIAEAQCMIVPSEWYENFPVSVMESLSLGTPVIASNIGGLPDMIEHNVTGLLFKAGDPDNLAECIKSLLSDSVRLTEMSNHATTAAKNKFSPEKHLNQLIDIYQHAITAYSR